MESTEVQYIENPQEQEAVKKIRSLKEIGNRLFDLEKDWISISEYFIAKPEFDRIEDFIKTDIKDTRAKLCEIRGD